MSFAKTDARSWFQRIGVRLTLWGTAVTLFVCLLLCIVLYAGIFLSLRREVDGFLEGEIHELRMMIAEHAGNYAAAESDIRREVGSRTRRDLYFRLLDSSGNTLLTSDPADPLPKPWILPPIGLPISENMYFQTITGTAGKIPLRVCSTWINARDATRQVAQVAYTLDRMSNSLGVFWRLCVLALMLAALLALVGGRMLARRSLEPVDLITESAKRIGAGRLTERIPRSGNNDELDRLAQTLNDMLDRIERQVRQIQQFTADASHELRTPLTALRGNAEVALTQSRNAEQLRQVIEESVDHYDRLSRIAEDLLLLARIDAGESILRPESVRLDEAVADVVDLYSPLASDRRLELSFSRRDEVWTQADGARVRQLVGNLLDNAIKYGRAEGHIDVSIARSNGLAVIQIADDGVGIPENDLPRVFDRFFRVDRARSGMATPGTGLGLAICRSIAEAHGGSIRLQSQWGVGTTAIVQIPVAAPDPDSGKK